MRRLMIIPIIYLSACSQPHVIAFQRGPIQGLEVDKQVRVGELLLSAERISAHQVELIALKCSDIKLTRRLKFSTIEWMWVNAHPAWEMFEIPYGILSLPMLPFFYFAGLMEPPPDREDFRYHRTRILLRNIFGAINPFERLHPKQMIINPESQRDLYRGSPFQIRYRMCQPVRDINIKYRLEDIHGEKISDGEVLTDWFGCFTLNDLPNIWMSVELSHTDSKYFNVLISHPKLKYLAQ